MQAKIRKPFGIWADSSYVAKVNDNAKLYRKIGTIAGYRIKCGLRANIPFIIKQLREIDEYNRILGANDDEKWRTNYYRSSFSHIKKCLTGAREKFARNH